MRKLLVVLAIVSASQKAEAETLASLIQDTRVLLVDSGTVSGRLRFTDAQITQVLNVGQREAITATHCLVKAYNFDSIAGTTYYAMPSDFVSITRVRRKAYGAMQELTPAALDGRSRNWQTASGSAIYYFLNFSTRTNIGLTPFPGVAADTDTYTVEYFYQPSDLSASTDLPFNGTTEMTDYHHALAYFAAAVLSAVDGMATQSQAYMQIFNSDVAFMGKRCLERQNYSPSAVSSP